MTRFLDGPALGQVFELSRAPHYLRIVRSSAGKWDALDQLDDTPKDDEAIFVYEMVGEPTWMTVRRDRRHGGCSVIRGGTYRLVTEQPVDAEVRTTPAWRDWVGSKVGRPIGEDGSAQEAAQ